MATKLNAGEVKRGDFFFVDPFQIMADEKFRGRWKPPTEEAIIEMAESLLNHGQQQPIQCRKIKPENKLQVCFGFTRTAAGRLIKTGFTDSEGNFRQDENFTLKVTTTTANDDDAFINNIIENAMRNETSPIDDAYNHKRLREQLGKTNAEIAKLYRCDVAKVSRYEDLLLLEARFQELVHNKILSVSGGLDLLNVPSDQRDAVVAKAMNVETGKINGAQIMSQVRDFHLRDHGHEHIGTPEPAKVAAESNSKGTTVELTATATNDAVVTPPRRASSKEAVESKESPAPNSEGPKVCKPLTLREIKTFFEEQKGCENTDIQEFCNTLLLFMAGRRAKITMIKALRTLAGEKK